jgi:hypothetical protein
VDVGDVADVSEEYAIPIFKIGGDVNEFIYIKFCFKNKGEKGR